MTSGSVAMGLRASQSVSLHGEKTRCSVRIRTGPVLVRGDFFGFVQDDAWIGLRGHGSQHVFFAFDQRGCVVAGYFETVAMGDGVSGTGLDAIAAKDAAVVVDVVDLGVTLAARDANLLGIFRRLDVNAVRRAGCRAKKTR